MELLEDIKVVQGMATKVLVTPRGNMEVKIPQVFIERAETHVDIIGMVLVVLHIASDVCPECGLDASNKRRMILSAGESVATVDFEGSGGEEFASGILKDRAFWAVWSQENQGYVREWNFTDIGEDDEDDEA